MTRPKAHVSEEKKKLVKELTDSIKNNRTVLVASIKNLPASKFQKVVKSLRGKATVKVPRKRLLFRAMDNSGKEEIKKIREKIQEGFAIVFSEKDSFELASELLESKTPAKAKAGQEAPEDITIEPGPTDLPPGPAISELGALGIQVQIEKGKITVKEPKTIVKKGEKISPQAAEVMGKLEIQPFSIGFIPISAFDGKENKVYLELNINPEEVIEEIKSAYGKALPFAVEIGYATDETIKYILGKAGLHEKSLNNVIKDSSEEKSGEGKPEEKEEEKETPEEKNESQTSENKSEEEK